MKVSGGLASPQHARLAVRGPDCLLARATSATKRPYAALPAPAATEPHPLVPPELPGTTHAAQPIDAELQSLAPTRMLSTRHDVRYPPRKQYTRPLPPRTSRGPPRSALFTGPGHAAQEPGRHT